MSIFLHYKIVRTLKEQTSSAPPYWFYYVVFSTLILIWFVMVRKLIIYNILKKLLKGNVGFRSHHLQSIVIKSYLQTNVTFRDLIGNFIYIWSPKINTVLPLVIREHITMRNLCVLLFLVGAVLTSAKKRYDGWVPFTYNSPCWLRHFPKHGSSSNVVHKTCILFQIPTVGSYTKELRPCKASSRARSGCHGKTDHMEQCFCILITFPKCTPENTKLYGVQGMVNNHPFVELLKKQLQNS